ncbi:MAG: hypothetical protein AAFV62_05220 [Pseudomonadota bacterium]
MKAFLIACVAIVAIAIGANAYLISLDKSSEATFQGNNVRLD